MKDIQYLDMVLFIIKMGKDMKDSGKTVKYMEMDLNTILMKIKN